MPSREQSVRQEELRTVYREKCLTIHLHQPTQCPHFYGGVPHLWSKSATYGDPVQPSPSEPVVSLLHGRHPICKFDGSVFAETSTQRPVAEGEEHNRDTIPTPRCAQRLSTGNSNSPLERVYPPTEYLCRINSGKNCSCRN